MFTPDDIDPKVIEDQTLAYIVDSEGAFGVLLAYLDDSGEIVGHHAAMLAETPAGPAFVLGFKIWAARALTQFEDARDPTQAAGWTRAETDDIDAWYVVVHRGPELPPLE